MLAANISKRGSLLFFIFSFLDLCFFYVDLSKEMESEGHSSHLGSGLSQEKSRLRLPSDVPAVEESKGNSRISYSPNKPFKRQKEGLYETCEGSKHPKSGKYLALDKDNRSQESEISKKDIGVVQKVKTPEDYETHTDCAACFCETEIMDAETTSPFSVTRKNVAAATLIRDCLGEGPSEEEIKQIDKHSGDDIPRMASRCVDTSLLFFFSVISREMLAYTAYCLLCGGKPFQLSKDNS